ncbi:MAG: hypothetical protein KBD52_03565 [Candidatus Pacebacteria bacterium]|nr:hypothetical protein [Candidatus Paceibacterota bacterium]
MWPKIKNIIIFLGIGIVLIVIYMFIIKKPADVPSLVTSSDSFSNEQTGNIPEQDSKLAKEFLGILLNVKSIRLEDAIFSDISFTSLNDSSILLIPDGTEGRPNPFAPLGNDLSANVFNSNTNTAPITQTLPPASTNASTTPANSAIVTPPAVTTTPSTNTNVSPGGTNTIKN